ncbi:uncharacterized protein LOC107006249 [Solanum pennellii]|uniref:Uncharacterized protein LOC107006249 n=1 Tax=Solanum pennellii TaxID=28526 RepID=A0ABM1FQR8_SOLPN|nr:uncharacterized protein LOC107006249 [Solanum pennellii]
MVKDVRSKMSLFVAEFGRSSSKECRAAMLIRDRDISRLISMWIRNQKGPALSSSSVPAPTNKGEYYSQNSRVKPTNSSGSVAQGGSKSPAYAKCGRNHIGVCHEGDGSGGNIAQSSLVAPPDRAAPRGATSSTGGATNHLYALNNCQEHENSPDVVTGMIQVFDITVYVLLDPGSSLSFVTPYISMNFNIILEQLSKPFNVSTPVGESILEERESIMISHSIIHKSTVVDLIELDIVDFDVTLGMD